MVQDRHTLIMYNTAVCNLHCVYCFIDKNPALVKIDEMLDESFKGDYYLDFAKEMFPDPNQLTEIQFWGGEPSLNFERVVPTVKKLLAHYPNLNQVMFSTNLSNETSVDEIYKLCRALKDNRPITLRIQMSIDGPTYINDANRGTDTTEKFTRNFAKLVSSIDSLLDEVPNLTIESFNKSTLDIKSIGELQSRERILEYFQFLEKFKTLSLQSQNPRYTFSVTVPNTACPLPITVEVGKQFANLCRIADELETENKNGKQYFKYYDIITPFRLKECHECAFANGGTCGSGKFTIGLLPNKMISTCHNGFTELLEDYKKYAMTHGDDNSTLQDSFFNNKEVSSLMVFPKEKLAEFETQIESFYNHDSVNYPMTLLGEVQFLAMNNQVDRKYMDIENARHAVSFIMTHSSLCLRDNLNISGVKTVVPVNLLKLFLNGALEIIESREGTTMCNKC